QLAAAAHAHPLDARVPAGDDLALPELELERPAAVPGRVELLAGGEGHAHVVHGDLPSLRRLVALADDDVLDPEVEGDVALGLLDLRPFECHRRGAYRLRQRRRSGRSHFLRGVVRAAWPRPAAAGKMA